MSKPRHKNKLVFLKKAEGRYDWYTCGCGNVKSIKRSHVNLGYTTSCDECCIRELPGTKIEKVSVLEYVGKEKRNHQFRCKCECGNEFITISTRLKKTSANHINSCGNCIDKNSMIGKKYGLLTVTKWLDYNGKTSHWEAICECGKIVNVTASNLNTKYFHSCGCGRLISMACRGENKAIKLDDEKVLLIRHMYYFERLMRKKHRTGHKKYKYNMQDLAKEFGISQCMCVRLIKSQSWAHLPNPNQTKNIDLRDGRYQYKG